MRTQFSGVTPGLGGVTKGLAGIGVYEDQIRQNMALFDRAMKMFSPFAYARPEDAPAPAPAEPAPPAAPPPQPSEDSLADLKRQLEAMQAQIEKLATKP
jgi:polyhydroxyalkanoate synthesis regulator protein